MDTSWALQSYAAAWDERAPENIRSRLDECWTATSTYTDPITDIVVGADALTAVIVEFGARFPAASLRPVSPLDTHHDVGRFSWVMTSAEPIEANGVHYGTEMSGLDFLEFTDDGRIARVVGFFGSTPASEP